MSTKANYLNIMKLIYAEQLALRLEFTQTQWSCSNTGTHMSIS